eukprot:1401964-Amphidinium_carterae.1
MEETLRSSFRQRVGGRAQKTSRERPRFRFGSATLSVTPPSWWGLKSPIALTDKVLTLHDSCLCGKQDQQKREVEQLINADEGYDQASQEMHTALPRADELQQEYNESCG